MNHFADVVLPLPLKKLTYRIPSIYHNMVNIGSGVLVPLHRERILLAIVVKLHSETPRYPTKALLSVIYEVPIFVPQQLRFLAWVASYYLSHLGEGLSLALLKPLYFPNNVHFEINHNTIPEKLEEATEALIITSLQYQTLSYSAIANLLTPKQANKAIISLLSKRLVQAVSATKIHQNSDVTYITYFSNTHSNSFQIDTHHLISPKQQALLSYFLQTESPEKIYASKKELLALGYSKSALNILLKQGILREVKHNQLPPPIFTTTLQPLSTLTAPQKNALIEVQKQFTKKPIVLLYGAIGSGKTELYLHLMQTALLQQKQVLLLLPEIGLVIHIVARIKPLWGEWLVVYHSKQSNKERLQTWSRVLNEKTLIVVGTRSALFLPFHQLQLIIVDEEHDHAYKQTTLAPTYHARDSGIILAQQHQAKVLLGSGTPSIESYYNAQSGKFGFVALANRFGTSSSPKLYFIDLNIEQKRKAMRENFSLILLSKLKQNITEGGQAMIFQNRRGYARYFLCKSCEWVPRCLTCAVSLTYHQDTNQLLCHYCGYSTTPFSACNSCGSKQLYNIGFGTEKLEETLQLAFPEQKIARMDLDSTKGKNSCASILAEVASGSIDILVGTQIIAKGLDFDNIRFIGVLDIDGLLYFPDFRSNEKCFQLITQLAGRAGRRSNQGSVFIQTKQPNHSLFRYLSNSDYQAMYRSELAERERFLYPPYVKLIKLTLGSPEEAILKLAAIALKKALEKKFKDMVLGPQQPLVGKIRNKFLLDIFIKIPSKNLNKLQKEKNFLQELCKQVLGVHRKIKILFDIDPI